MTKNTSSLCILLKGASLKYFSDNYQNYDNIMIVSDFEDELKDLKPYLQNKDIIHFVNRSFNARLKNRTYRDLKVRQVQLSTKLDLFDIRVIKKYLYLKLFNWGLMINFIPGSFDFYSQNFPSSYKNKFPNTGILAILFAVNVLKIKNIHIYGLDFYTTDYHVQQTLSPNITTAQQAQKISNLDLIQFIHEFMIENSSYNFYIKSYYDEWPLTNNIFKL